MPRWSTPSPSFDALGRDRFLERGGFGRSKSYFLDLDGKVYVAAFLLLALSGCQPAPTVTAPTQPTVTASASAEPTVSAPATAPADPTVVDTDRRGYIEATGQHRTVKRVSDGDTIVVLPGVERRDHVRALTINTPERHVDTNGPADCGADDAWHALQGLLPVGTEVILKGLAGEPATYRFDRTLANIYVDHDGQLLNVSLWLAGVGPGAAPYPLGVEQTGQEVDAVLGHVQDSVVCDTHSARSSS